MSKTIKKKQAEFNSPPATNTMEECCNQLLSYIGNSASVNSPNHKIKNTTGINMT